MNYTTLQLIYDFSNNLGGFSKASKLLGFGTTYLSDLKQRITNCNVKGYNPQYKFSIKNLNIFKENLERIIGENSDFCIYKSNKYIKYNIDLKQYSGQQYRDTLKSDYFEKIDTLEKSYWLGFLYADGQVTYKYKDKPWYRISIELSIKDRKHLENFCREIGMNPSELIKERIRYKKYKNKIKKYQMVYMRFRCKPMVENLMNIGFSSSKSLKKSIPKLLKKDEFHDYDSHFRWKLLLAWLLGYYDGDGQSNSTKISSSSKKFLKDIKSEFNIKFDVKLIYNKGEKFYLEEIVSTRPHWSLTLGSSLFNEMMRNYPNSMQRKRRSFNERDMELYDRLKKLALNRENLQTLINKNQINVLLKKYNVSTSTFYRLCREWKIITPRMRIRDT